MPFRIEDVPAERIKAVLAFGTDNLPKEEVSAVKDFIERIGGNENVELAGEMLEELARGGCRNRSPTARMNLPTGNADMEGGPRESPQATA